MYNNYEMTATAIRQAEKSTRNFERILRNAV